MNKHQLRCLFMNETIATHFHRHHRHRICALSSFCAHFSAPSHSHSFILVVVRCSVIVVVVVAVFITMSICCPLSSRRMP